MWTRLHRYFLLGSAALTIAGPAWGQAFQFSTGNPDGAIATASRPDANGLIEIETADDFALAQETAITNGTFTGLLPANTDVTGIQNVIVEIYRIFPADSVNPPSGNVPTRTNSPSDVALTSFDASLGQLTFTTSLLSSNFTVANSVINGINGSNPFTGGEGAMSGREVQFSFSLTANLDLPAGHYFFVPQVQLADGSFLWLSAARPIVAPGTQFPTGFTDLQSWIRNENLAPDWLRVGTDITHQGPFNAAFSLAGIVVPEPASWMMMLSGFAAIGLALRRRRRSRTAPPDFGGPGIVSASGSHGPPARPSI